MAAARGLISVGFDAGDGLVILAPNRPEWVIADLAAIARRGNPDRAVHHGYGPTVRLHYRPL